MAMKIIFICNDPKFHDGEDYTPESVLCVSIEDAASAAIEIDSIIKAIDISDLMDIEDVTDQVAKAVTRLLFEAVDIVPEVALGCDMSDLIAELKDSVAEDNAVARSEQAQYAQGRM